MDKGAQKDALEQNVPIDDQRTARRHDVLSPYGKP